MSQYIKKQNHTRLQQIQEKKTSLFKGVSHPLTNICKSHKQYKNTMMAISSLSLLTFLSLSLAVSCLSSLSFSFNNTATSNFIMPTYPLGLIQPNTTISISINTLSNAMDLSSANIELVTSFDYTLVYQFSCAGQACKDYYYIPAQSLAQYYYLRIYLNIGLDILPQAFISFYLNVASYSGTFSYVSGTKELVLIKIVDVLRKGINKYIYVDSQKNIQITIYPIANPLASADSAVRLVQVDPNSGWLLSYGNVISLSTDVLTIVSDNGATTYGIYKFSATVPQGYYVLLVTYDIEKPMMVLTWQSDPFPCAYSPQYIDYFYIYQGCTAVKTYSSGLPCLIFDSNQMICKSCIQGYQLSQGQCIYNISCQPRQYFRYGQCLPVSSSCGDFDLYTGDCLTCTNASFALINSSCIQNTISCGARQILQNKTCVEVDTSCDTFNPLDGSCLSCLNSTYFTLFNGKCIMKIADCTTEQVLIAQKCLDIPPSCLQFDVDTRRCTTCSLGFLLKDRQCQPIICAESQVHSPKGDSCVDVSVLCDSYNHRTGNCLTCHRGYNLINGACSQTISPLAGCAALQQLGFGICANTTLNCRIHNLITGSCEQCQSDYYLDYKGHCQKVAQCGIQEKSINGLCFSLPIGCIRADDLGLCVECNHNNYRLILGQCVIKPNCNSRQYLNQNNVCVDVSETCDQFNPTTGSCISCINGTRLNSGNCCPIEDSSSNPQCSKQPSPSFSSSCLISHPSLGICLQCRQGYLPAYSSPTSICLQQ